MTWRVLVVDDDAEVRDFVAQSVAACPGLELVACVGSVLEARLWLDDPSHSVDVLLTDLGLPDGSGLELIRLASRRDPPCEALVISVFGDDDHVLASIEAGALGYLHKDETPANIAQTILDMKRGASPISPMVARRVLAKYRMQQQPAPVAAPQGIDVLLTPREKEVLELFARGFSYAEIARLQELSVHTVRSHVKTLYTKLAVHSKNEAVFEATQMGLLRPSLEGLR
jgi:DNA-binding NarL/FixJ family response regulator